MYYASQRLLATEKNYSIIEREALRMIYSVTKFQYYLLGQKFTFHVDHLALIYFVTKQSLKGKLAQWMLLLHEFKFSIHHQQRVQHVEVDYLSHLESREPTEGVPDDLPDVRNFRINVAPPNPDTEDKSMDELLQFLNTNLPLAHLTLDEKKRLAI